MLLCSTAKFSDYEVHCVSSVLDRNGKLWIFTARMNFIEAFKVEMSGDSVFINKNSQTTIKTSNSMKFLAIEKASWMASILQKSVLNMFSFCERAGEASANGG